jgi:aldehyde dehydrogenase (NAD+)
MSDSPLGLRLSLALLSDESEIVSVYAASVEDVDTAVAAARKALKDPSWRDLPPTDRGNMIIKLSDLIAEHAETLATIETWDNGKIYADSLGGDVEEVKGCLRYYGGYADKIHGDTIDVGPAKFAYTIKEPVGVCGQIIPWNYPLAMAAWKLGPALACGNTIVIKAAEQTPLSILYLANLIKEAGFPPGVVNILNGYGREAGAAIATHLGIDKVAFTGSTATGKEIMKLAAVNMKNITLETGGKSPLIVFDDAELDQAVKWAHIGMSLPSVWWPHFRLLPLFSALLLEPYFIDIRSTLYETFRLLRLHYVYKLTKSLLGIMSNQGQICTATSRILVQDSIYDKFIDAFKAQVKEVSVVGDPFAESTFQGPQVTKTQYERVLGFVKAGKDEGATLVSGGEQFTSGPTSGKGFFITPTIFSDVKPNMKIYREEVFGPFVVIASFKTEDEALDMANDTTYGLGSAVFTQNLTRAHRVAKRIEAGMVWINSSNDSDYRIPFGGVKQSGIGRELGEAGLAAYSQTKSVHVNIGSRL